MTDSDDRTVRIHYRRPPDGEDLFVQQLVHDSPDVIVTLLERTPLRRPMLVQGRVVLEPDAPVVWFTFPGAWHDIGRFHKADGTFTGYYSNILTPVEFDSPRVWRTTDLFLDIFVDAMGIVSLLDAAQFWEAVRAGWIDQASANRAQSEAARIQGEVRRHHWPPAPVLDWTLERARAVIAGDG